MERPRVLREWVGLRCRLRRDVRLGAGTTLAAGTVLDVRGRRGGEARHALRVKMRSACPTCGVRAGAYLGPDDLEPLERVGPPEPARRRR